MLRPIKFRYCGGGGADDNSFTHELDITLKSESASARFKASPELDEEVANLLGIYRKLTHAGRLVASKKSSLSISTNMLGLFREFECKP
jgi:hypothetical protein